MNRNKIFILIGILQIVSILNMMPFYYRLVSNSVASSNMYDQTNILFYGSHIVLFLMVLVSIFLYFRQNRYALRLYYFESVLRIMIFTTTFGFILKLNILVQDQVIYNYLAVLVVALEVIRLIISILLDIKWKTT
jgi:hypothetical protein